MRIALDNRAHSAVLDSQKVAAGSWSGPPMSGHSGVKGGGWRPVVISRQEHRLARSGFSHLVCLGCRSCLSLVDRLASPPGPLHVAGMPAPAGIRRPPGDEWPGAVRAVTVPGCMPRGACLLGGGREEVIAALDGQLALIFACCAPGMLPRRPRQGPGSRHRVTRQSAG